MLQCADFIISFAETSGFYGFGPKAYEWKVGLENNALKVSAVESDFAKLLRSFRLDVLKDGDWTVTAPAELSAVAIRDFQLEFELEDVTNYFGNKARDKKGYVEV